MAIEQSQLRALPRNGSSRNGMSSDPNEGLAGDFVEIGSTGLNRQGGYINEEFLPALQGQRAAEVFKQMGANDPIVGALLFAIDMYLRKVEWDVEAVSDKKEDVDRADFVRDCMQDMSHTWTDFISEVLTMLQFGWSWFEIVYKKRDGHKDNRTQLDEDGYQADPNTEYQDVASSKYSDGKIGWRKFGSRAQETLRDWIFDPEGGLQAMRQAPPNEGQEYIIPIEKSLLFRTRTHKNNPEGRSILRNAYRPWFYKTRIEETEGIGIERDLAGLPVVHMPAEFLTPGATQDQKRTVEAMRQLVKNIRRDEQEGILFPVAYDEDNNEMFRLELMSSSGNRQFNTDAIIERYDKRIAMTVLADFILLGSDATGSYALSVSKTGMFQAALEAWLDSIADILNTYALPRLFRLNGWDTEEMPVIKHDNVQAPTLEDLAALITAMTGSGAALFPDTDLENYIRRTAGLPEKPIVGDEQTQKDVEAQNRLAREDVRIPKSSTGAKPIASTQEDSGKESPPQEAPEEPLPDEEQEG